MTTLNAIEPTPEQIKKFLSDKKAGEPVYMLNLLKFKDRATYKSGENVSGREAYARYASAFSKLVKDKKIEGGGTLCSVTSLRTMPLTLAPTVFISAPWKRALELYQPMLMSWVHCHASM